MKPRKLTNYCMSLQPPLYFRKSRFPPPPDSRKIPNWWSLHLASWPQTTYYNSVSGFKFGSMVRYHHYYNIHAHSRNFGRFQFGSLKVYHKTVKSNSPSNFLNIPMLPFTPPKMVGFPWIGRGCVPGCSITREPIYTSSINIMVYNYVHACTKL